MTRDQILGMQAGIELDAIVAAKVFDWDDGTYRPSLKRFSSDMTAAWEVVEYLNGGEYATEIGRAGDYYQPDRKWQVRFGMSGWAEAYTAPLAICRAALLTTLGKGD